MARWIAVFIVGVSVLASAYVFGRAWGDFLAESRQIRDVRSKVAQIEAAKQTKIAQMAEVAVWNQLWGEVRESKFDPDNWVTTPVNLSRDMHWSDFQDVMLLVSNANTRDAGYWFRPQTLRMVKLAPPAETEGRTGGEGEASVEPAPVPRPINVHISGEFLRMKDS